eukprot:gene32487-41236_t
MEFNGTRGRASRHTGENSLKGCCNLVICTVIVVLVCVFVGAVTQFHRPVDDDDSEEGYQTSTSTATTSPPSPPYRPASPPPEATSDVETDEAITANVTFNVKSYTRSTNNYVWERLHNETLIGSGADVVDVSVTSRCTPSWFSDAFCVNLLMRFENRSSMGAFLVRRVDRDAETRFAYLSDAGALASNRWDPSDVFRWNVDIFRNDDHRFVAHLHSWSTDSREVVFLYHEELRVAYNTIVVDKRSARSTNASGEFAVLDILVVPDATPREVLQASPVWKDAVNLGAYDDRLSWRLSGTLVSARPSSAAFRMPSQTFAFGTIQTDTPIRIVIDDVVSTDFVFELQDAFGYGLCMPTINRYVSGGGTQNKFDLVAHPHFGYFSVVSHGIIISSGASFSQIPTLQMPQIQSSSSTFRIPHAPASTVEGCAFGGANRTQSSGRLHR